MTDSQVQGALFVYQSTIINGAGGGGDCSVTLTPGQGNEFELYWGTISHDDATASDVDVQIRDDGARVLATLYDVDAVVQNALCQFPPAPGTSATSGNDAPAATRFFISGTMDLFMAALAIDLSEGTTNVIVGRVYGSVPTITESGNSTPAITINTERTY